MLLSKCCVFKVRQYINLQLSDERPLAKDDFKIVIKACRFVYLCILFYIFRQKE